MGAGTFLSSRRFWEIRDSCGAVLTPGLPSPPPATLRPSSNLLFPQIFHPPTAAPTLSSSLRATVLTWSSSDLLLLPQTLTSSLRLFYPSSILRLRTPSARSLSPSEPLWAERRHPLPPIWAHSHFSTGRKGAREWEGLGQPSSTTS